jgi:hypothetical protein
MRRDRFGMAPDLWHTSDVMSFSNRRSDVLFLQNLPYVQMLTVGVFRDRCD